MRGETEMLDLILNIAKNDERVRAVMMNGSRANPNAPRDMFQDFDIVYFVTDVESFTRDHAWIDVFGERMILQMPDAMGDPPPEPGFTFGYLMQFMDGSRIDLTLFPVAKLPALEKDSQTIVLLDKDGILPPFPPPSDSDYLPKPPTARQFDDCCNEFWWVSAYVAKGLWRRELTYAKGTCEEYVRPQLMKMLTWYVGVRMDFSASPGKMGKYLKRYLEPERWTLLEKTYADADYERSWDALFAMCDLFRAAAHQVAARFGYEYPRGDDERVSAHLRHVRNLPGDAKAMY
jgi:aminoglycoside 6-adenylyltransferase